MPGNRLSFTIKLAQMPTLKISNYTHQAAKAIIFRMYEADKQAATIQSDGLVMRGNNIHAEARGEDDSYTIEITSSVYDESTLKGFVEEGLDKL
jgi:hypothetical protein